MPLYCNRQPALFFSRYTIEAPLAFPTAVGRWPRSLAGLQEEMVARRPQRFFKPPTSARGVFSNWLGVWLDTLGITPAHQAPRETLDEYAIGRS